MTVPRRPLVSVVVPAFNAAPWIADTLASVAAQTADPDDLELLIVDDGSSDDTVAAARESLAHARCRWNLICRPNGGPGRARNVGWQAAAGQWIQFLDADDLLDPDKLAIQLRRAALACSDTAVIYSAWTTFGLIDARWERPGLVVQPRLHGDVVEQLLHSENAIATGAQLYARNWLARVGGWDERWTNGEDHDLAVRVAFEGGRFVEAAADRPLFFYRRHGPAVTSLTTRSGRLNAEAWLRVAGMVEDQSRARHQLTPGRARQIARIYAGFGKWLSEYDWTAATAWFDRLERIEPRFLPEWSPKLRHLSRVLGFRRAAWVAARIRRLRRAPAASPHLVAIDPPRFTARPPGVPAARC
jgi:glycosyltransferase involved in cell wall biosynthesis